MPVHTDDPQPHKATKQPLGTVASPRVDHRRTAASAPTYATPLTSLRPRLWIIAAVAASLVLVCLLVLAGPKLAWTYHMQRAGALMNSGLRWPTPRLSDSLPVRQDDAALTSALDQLLRASYWQPTDPLAYRLNSQVYAAQGNWPLAAAQLDYARKLDPHNPLLAWEAGLMYEQMQRIIERALPESIMDQLADAHVVAPGQLIKSQFCRASGADTCYFGQTEYTLPFADSRDTKAVTSRVLFLHPPAHIEQTIQIPPERAALNFTIGLDPVARAWKTDGATFRVAVVPPGGTLTTVQTLTLDRKTALRGWVNAWADLSRWAGQTVTLVLVSDGGPSGDITDDWYGWANIALTNVNAKQYEALRPRSRMLDAWDDAKLSSDMFEARGDEARNTNHPEEAQAWYQRATVKRGIRK